MAARAEEHVAGLEVRIDGRAVDPTWADRLLEARVRDNLMLPDTVLVRFADPHGTDIDSSPVEVGKSIEVLVGAIAEEAVTSIFKGTIAAVEPEFAAEGVVIAARGYDRSHKLTRERHSRTFQNQTSADIVKKVASEAGLSPGTVQSTGSPHPFMQQNNETDWEFIWRLAALHDFEFVAEDSKFHFRKAGGGGATPITLRYREGLVSFKPRVSGAQQANEVIVRGHEPLAKTTLTGRARSGATSSRNGLQQGDVAKAVNAGTVVVADRPVNSQAEADAIAQATLDQLANTYVEAEGVAQGNPRLRAGSKVRIEGVGKRFSGEYTLSSTTHLHRGGRGYETHITISGRTPRSLIDLLRPRAKRDWGGHLVIGIVTNNNDPEGLGRVRVRFPALGDNLEGWWARIATASAGKERGLLMLPQAGDEVVVGFEHGDTRKPYVLGAVWNGKEKPGTDLVRSDGSFSVRSDHHVSMTAAEDIVLTSKKDMKVEVDSNLSTHSKKDWKHKSDSSITVEAGMSVTIKAGASMTIEASGPLKLKGATVDLEASGPVNVKGAIINLG